MIRRILTTIRTQRRLSLGAAITGARACLLAIALSGMAGLASADPYCGLGQHVGAENDGVGKSWTCVPDGVRGSPNSRQNVFQVGPTQANRVAAGMALGAAGADLVGALLGILGGDNSGLTPEQLQEIQDEVNQRINAREAAAEQEAAAYEDEGRKAAAAGNYAGAFNAFKHAYERSGDFDYQRNMIAMESLLHLQEALALTAEKKRAAAYNEFLKSKALAEEAYRPDIAQRIETYRVQLFAQMANTQTGAPGAAPSSTRCVSVNGEFVCD